MHLGASVAPIKDRAGAAIGSLMAASGWQTKIDLEGVVTGLSVSVRLLGGGHTLGHLHQPLEARQCSDHDDSDREAVPQATKTNVLVDSAHGASGALTG